MSTREFRNWRSVQEEVLRRINAREWKPGELIPNESDLAVEFGCARATVNRALQSLADVGLLDRRRKAGTRVAMHPIRKATLHIPIIRQEIESKGLSYHYSLISNESCIPPQDMIARMQLSSDDSMLHLIGIHMANDRPYVFENRWINPAVVPAVASIDFTQQSPNEWLVENVPFNHGDISFSAMSASIVEADILGCQIGEGLFVIDRSTWNKTDAITSVRLVFAPGYRMHTEI